METFTARRAYQIAAAYRARGIPVVMGGYHVTLCPEEAAAHADAIVTGASIRFMPSSSTGNEVSFYRILQDWPDAALEGYGLDARTAVITLTHDPKLDDMALMTALESRAFYVGALGSRENNRRRRQRLLKMGLKPAAVERLRGPVGLPLGGKTPPEIAVAIAAEIEGRHTKGLLFELLLPYDGAVTSDALHPMANGREDLALAVGVNIERRQSGGSGPLPVRHRQLPDRRSPGSPGRRRETR